MKLLKNLSFLTSLLLLIFVVLTSGCAKKEASEPPQNVATMTVSSSPGGYNIKLAGQIMPRFESKLAFQSKGIIKERFVNLGDRVKAGDVLLRLDPIDYSLNAQQTQSQVQAARSALSLAEITLKRSRYMYEQGAVSQQQLDQDTQSYQSALANLNALESQSASSQQQLSYTALIAPTDGVISMLSAEVGDVVDIGKNVLNIAKDSDWEAEVYVPENNRNLLVNNPNMDTRIYFWAYPDLVINGKVREMSAVADPTTRTYRVRVSMNNLPPRVDLGMTSTVEFIPPDKVGIYVPLTAVLRTADSAPTIWLSENGILKAQAVTLGQFGTNNNIEVTSGLQDGQVIVVSGVMKLREGQHVTPWDGQATRLGW